MYQCIKYAVNKSSGLTPLAARRLYQFEEMSQREDVVEKAIEDVQDFHESMLVKAKDKAIFLLKGITTSSSCKTKHLMNTAVMSLWTVLLHLRRP